MPDGIVVRAAVAADGDAIDSLVRTAFARSRFGYHGEAELVRMIEADGDALVSLVAERNGAIVGQALFSRMDVEADSTRLPAAALAPVSVAPDCQAQGVGSALIRAGLHELRRPGTQICFVLGDESYYPRFGYSPELAARFASPFAGPHFMAMMLDSESRWPQGGRADYAPAFGRLG